MNSTQAVGRLIVVCQDVPYPPRHGGQSEAWMRLNAWRSLGISLHVVFWGAAHENVNLAKSALQEAGCSVTALPRRRSLSSLFRAAVPPRAFSMRPRPKWYQALMAALVQFDADGIILESWPGALTAFQLGDDLQLPVLYRSQNVESEYWQAVHSAARGMVRLQTGFTARRIHRFEQVIRTSASVVLDISEEDTRRAAAGRMQGKSIVLPPVWGGKPPRDGHLDWQAEVDVIFGGSLSPPHHVEGIEWLLREVLPSLRQQYAPMVTMRIIGAQATARVRSLTASCGVDLLVDVDDFHGELMKGRVLVNPVQRSSGINMKMLDYIASGLPVVSTTAGVRGLSSQVKGLVLVADKPKDFAAAICTALNSAMAPDRVRPVDIVESEYGPEAQRRILREIFRVPLGSVGRVHIGL